MLVHLKYVLQGTFAVIKITVPVVILFFLPFWFAEKYPKLAVKIVFVAVIISFIAAMIIMMWYIGYMLNNP